MDIGVDKLWIGQDPCLAIGYAMPMPVRVYPLRYIVLVSTIYKPAVVRGLRVPIALPRDVGHVIHNDRRMLAISLVNCSQ